LNTHAASKFTGSALTSGPQSTEATVTPSYTGCRVVVAGITKLVTVTMNHCHYKFNATTSSTATVAVECDNTGESIEIHVYNSKTSETTTICTFDVTPQGPLGGITLTNSAAGVSPMDIIAHIDATVTMDNTIHSSVCGQNATETATYEGEDTITATDALGNPVDLTVS
jgi:uncharacterized membrane protein